MHLLLVSIAVCFVIVGEAQWTQGTGMPQRLGPWFLLVGCLVFLGELVSRTGQSWGRYIPLGRGQRSAEAFGQPSERAPRGEPIQLASAPASVSAPTAPLLEQPSQRLGSAPQRQHRSLVSRPLLVVLFGLLLGVMPLFIGGWVQLQYFAIVRAYAARPFTGPYDANTSATLDGLMQTFFEAELVAYYGVLPVSMLLVFRPVRFFTLGLLLGVLIALGSLFVLNLNFE